MKLRTFALTLAATLALPSSAFAHFVWIHVLGGGGARVELFFGDGVWEDVEPSLVRYVEGVELWTPAGASLAVTAETGVLSTRLPAGESVVLGRRDMGLFSRPGGGPAVKLDYYAKGTATLAGAAERHGTRGELTAAREGDELVLGVWFDGAPAAGATVVVPRADSTGTGELVADAEGRVRLPLPRGGVFAARAKVTLPTPGELDAEPYQAEHHWATLTIADLGTLPAPASGDRDAWLALEETQRLLERLPATITGLAGVLEVSVDARAFRGEFEYRGGALRQLELEGMDAETRAPVAAHVVAMVEGRLARDFAREAHDLEVRSAPRDGHPLGRLVRAHDAAGTSWRIEERQLRAVDRSEGATRTSTRFLEYETTGDGRFLPRHVLRSTYDRKSGALLASEAWSDTFVRADGRWLPATRRVLREGDGGESVLALRMRNLELFEASERAD